MPEATPIEALNATKGAIQSLIVQIGDKFGQIDTGTTAQLNAAIATLETRLLGSADVDNNTLGKLAARINALQGNLQALDETYATDADLAAKIIAINEAWATADGDIQALIADKINAADAQQLISTAVSDFVDNGQLQGGIDGAKAHSDQQLVAALQGLTATFQAGEQHLASL